MSARHKLNVAYINGSLILAGIIGLMAQSWSVFLVTLAVLLGLAWYSGDIRPGGRR